MYLDVRTLFVANAVTTIIIGLALLFYARKRKAYPGFSHWMLGTLIVSMSYVGTILRGSIPELMSILAVNGGFVLSGVLRLDGARRFLQGKALHRMAYLVPVLSIVLASYFFLFDNNMNVRLALLTLWTCGLLWSTAYVFLVHAPEKQRPLHRIASAICFLYGSALLVRTMCFVNASPDTIFRNSAFNSAFFISALVFEIWSGLLIMMMNSQKLEDELRESHEMLRDHVVRLETAISEVKILRGLLPICASCKKIRDDQGRWNQLEAYIDAHSEATFSHGICPECAHQLHFD